MTDLKLKNRRIALIGLALGSFVAGSRILYLFKGALSDTIMIDSVITGAGFVIAGISLLGFEAWKIEALHTLSAEDKEKFIPVCLEEDILALYDEARKIFGV